QAGEAIEIGYAMGCANHKFLPPADALNSLQGLDVEYYNSPDLSGEVVARETKPGSEIMWFHDVAPGVHAKLFSARLRTRFTALESGTHQFSLVSAGVSRLFVDGQLVVDNWDGWQPGDSYFGSGSAEAIGTTELKAGQSYDLLVEYSARTRGMFSARAIRIGAFRPLPDDAIERAAELAAGADAALVFVGLNGDWDTEGNDRPHMDLVGQQDELIERVAAANPSTVVVLQTGGPVSMPWIDKVAGVLQAWYPGQECGNAIADVLFGAVNPSGKLPQSFPVRLEDNPAFLNYPGENGVVTYGEGIFVGYRYYEKKKIAPLFPFGFGLSYTRFSYSNLRLSAATIGPDEPLTVRVDVTNTGERAGQEIVQLYVADKEARLARPEKELKGFAKVALDPGQTATVEIALDRRSLSYWDDARHDWVAEPGEFTVLVGGSSDAIQASATLQLTT
ncbi:MAG TPA: glycoside hydrolase family 3 C-terminal domain-containing protein, partial [Roseiflexaceae bacterium]|nr:glycoside hydrolase family 3 C-terminal domain-containing protein [Roseiflexaceae bacterium]